MLSYIIMLYTGWSLQVESTKVKNLVVTVLTPSNYTYQTQGLMGTYDGNKDNEFKLANGTVWPANSSENAIYQFGRSCELLL